MGRDNIYKTLSVSSIVSKNTIEDLIDFLIDSRSHIVPTQRKNELFKTRFVGNSLLSEMAHKLSVLGKEQEYSLIKLPAKTIALREVVDMSFIPFDILQMKELVSSSLTTLSLIPEINDKMIINITDITKSNGEFSDASQFHYRVIRDFFSRSYFMSQTSVWISPTFVRYIAKVYNMTISGQLARLYGLSPIIQTFIQTVFCLFFVNKMTSLDHAQTFTKVHAKYLGIKDSPDLVQIFAFVEDVLGKKAPENLIDVCKVIDAYGHDQLIGPNGSRLSIPVLNTRFASWFSDGHVSMIALEYPPYFAFLVLLVLSNIRIGLSFSMKNMNVIKEGHDVFEQNLRSSMFMNAI